jgi:HEPN domain-containing protein
MSARVKIAKGGTRLSLFRQVALERFRDADLLAKHGRSYAAVYLAGYAVECLLKLAVGKKTGSHLLPAIHEHHELDVLLSKSGLQPSLQKQQGLQAIFSEISQEWGPHLRYRTSLLCAKESDLLFQRMNELYKWLLQELR